MPLSPKMKLPDPLSFLHKKPEGRKLFLSLALDVDAVGAAVWHIGPHGQPEILSRAWESTADDSWDSRIQAADRALTLVEDKAHIGSPLVKVVLGLPADYITQNGDIDPAARAPIKKLTKSLELEPIGFVPIAQALAYLLKRDEGVPASVIFLGVTKSAVTISLYKIGILIGQKAAPLGDSFADEVEAILKSFDGDDILPSRMLLYGGQSDDREKVRALLLKHPWPTRVNFLHFPKIELLPQDSVNDAVCIAGATELATTMGEEPDRSDTAAPREVAPQAANQVSAAEAREEAEEEIVSEDGSLDGQAGTTEEKIEGGEGEESNVVMVDPVSLGFAKNKDVLEEVQGAKFKVQNIKQGETETERAPISFPKIALPHIDFPSFRLPESGKSLWMILAGALVGIVLFAFLLYWLLAKATVTVLVLPQAIDVKSTVTVDPTATLVDSATKTIPGLKQEKSVSGKKSMPVVGKKNVGDPAKGTVMIYNKNMTSAKTFLKGSVLTSGSLQFTLDDAVSVASASESLSQGTTTYGKATGSITAVQIGPQSNMPAGNEFTFKDTSSSVATARNDAALTGGTSREVTVVTRADYDALTKALTDELVAQAKKDLAGTVGGGQKLIDATVKTTIGEKTFVQELDQEAKELNGKLTVLVSGIAYRDDDIKSFLTESAGASIPAGYTLSPARTEVVVTDVTVKKDGKVVMSAHLTSVALPTMDTKLIQAGIAGKKLESATEFLKSQSGVAGAEFSFSWMPWKNRLPLRKQNIFVTIAIQE